MITGHLISLDRLDPLSPTVVRVDPLFVAVKNAIWTEYIGTVKLRSKEMHMPFVALHGVNRQRRSECSLDLNIMELILCTHIFGAVTKARLELFHLPLRAVAQPFPQIASTSLLKPHSLHTNPIHRGKRRKLWQNRVQQDDTLHSLTGRLKLMCHLESSDAASRETANRVGPFRLHLSNFFDVRRRHFLKSLVRLFIPIEPTRL